MHAEICVSSYYFVLKPTQMCIQANIWWYLWWCNDDWRLCLTDTKWTKSKHLWLFYFWNARLITSWVCIYMIMCIISWKGCLWMASWLIVRISRKEDGEDIWYKKIIEPTNTATEFNTVNGAAIGWNGKSRQKTETLTMSYRFLCYSCVHRTNIEINIIIQSSKMKYFPFLVFASDPEEWVVLYHSMRNKYIGADR